MRVQLTLSCVFWALVACTPARSPVASFLLNKKAAVFVFLATDCPLSQSYTLTLNNLGKDFEPKGIGFYGVFSGDAVSKTAIDEFVASYHVSFPVTLDTHGELADFFGASTTPEAFVTDPNGRTLYKGAIDNWAPELGQHRTVITQRYLYDALQSVQAGKPVQVKATQAVGCFIERKNPN
jgi:hypothetical protein